MVFGTLNFTWLISSESVNFLDLIVSNKPDYLTISIFYKPTDSHNIIFYSIGDVYRLIYTSCHASSCKDAIPFAKFKRIRRICSDDTDFYHMLNLHKIKMTASTGGQILS